MTIHRNLCPAILSEMAVMTEKDSKLTSTGAVCVLSGKKTGRSPNDKRVVDEPLVHNDVWWRLPGQKSSAPNFPLAEDSFLKLLAQATQFIDAAPDQYHMDLFCGWDPKYRFKVRVITTRAYHALFMSNMLIRPTAEELKNFGKPDYTIYNAGQCLANRSIPGVTSDTCVALSFSRREQVILGSEYAGEMKKGMLTVMMYAMAKAGHLCMHASANEGTKGDVSVFFGLSGTGKTTLSADPKRALIGDDEHVWTDHGIFNVEGGCYAKGVGLSAESDPEIFNAIKFGCVVENCIVDDKRVVDYNNTKLTENTRVSYPLENVSNAKLPAIGGHPRNVIFLTNDAYGVLPPVSKLTLGQAMFWFISGYTAKVPGTETGVVEPSPTFSPCFGGPFLVMHPTYYGKQLAEKLQQHNANCWLVNTGWSGGPYGKGKRMKLSITRAIIDAIHDGSLANEQYQQMPGWGLHVPKACRKVDPQVLMPINTWADKKFYVQCVNHVSNLFRQNFEQYKSQATPDMLAAIPGQYVVAGL